MKQEQVRRDNRTLFLSICPTEGEMRGFLKLALNNLTYFLSSPGMIILSTSGCLLHLSSVLVPVLTLQTRVSEAWYLLATVKFNLGTEPLGILYTCSVDDTVIVWTTGLGKKWHPQAWNRREENTDMSTFYGFYSWVDSGKKWVDGLECGLFWALMKHHYLLSFSTRISYFVASQVAQW